MTRSLGDLTWTEVEELDAPMTLVVPVGSFEQHGPHLPLDTDIVVAQTVAERAVRSLPTGGHPPVFLGPVVALGSAGEHQGFAGTLSIGQPATADTLIELTRSAITDEPAWCARMVFVVGHGGNAEPVARAVRVARSESRRVDCWFPTDPDGDAHAGRTETSVMLAIDPKRVRPFQSVRGFGGPLGHVREHLVGGGLAGVTPTGVLGDPRGASAGYGQLVLDRWVSEVTKLIGIGADTVPKRG